MMTRHAAGSGAENLPYAAKVEVDFGPKSGRSMLHMAEVDLVDVLSEWMSKAEARRLIKQGGVKIDDYVYKEAKGYVHVRRAAKRMETIEPDDAVTVGPHKYILFIPRPYPRWRVALEEILGWWERNVWDRWLTLKWALGRR